jgi:serine/threonine protein kinase/Flp pilus assembly protein TadD
MKIDSGMRLSRYRVETLIGKGGMGEVYKAHDESLDRDVALKILRPELTTDPERVLRFVREAKMASSLNHPHIVHVYDVGESNGARFIVMEYVQGKTLRELFGTGVPMHRMFHYLIDVAEALGKAHASHIVHRDLKPENILVSDDGYAKIADFGLAKLFDDGAPGATSDGVIVTADGVVMGTVGYMAPEQLLGHPVDHRADIFAFGCILHEMILGIRPFAGASAFETMHQIVHDEAARLPAQAPPGLQSLVDRCLAKRPADRYQSAADLAAALRTFTHSPADAHETQTQRLPDVRRGRPATSPRFWIGITVLVAVAATTIGLLQKRSPSVVATAPVTTTTVPRSAYTPDSRAYDAYVRAKVNVTYENQANNDKAIALLQEAVAIDPKFAAAYAMLARAYNIKAFYFAPRAEKAALIEDAQVAVEKALAVDPKLADAHLARGLVLWTHENRFPHEEAIKSYQQALKLDPQLDEAHHQLGLIYMHVGLFDRSWDETEQAVRINPANTLARFRLGVIHLYRGRYEEALSIFNSTPLKKSPALWTFQTATVLFHLGRNAEASRLLDEYLEKHPNDEGGVGSSVRAILFARAGNHRAAEAAIRDAVRLGEGYGHFHHTAFNIAGAYATMNKPADAVRWLQTAADDGMPCYGLVHDEPLLASLHGDPSYEALLNRLQSDMKRYERLVDAQ